jgi:hypothetical protein
MTEPDNLVLQLLSEMRGKLDGMATKDDLRSEVADLRSEMNSLRADGASDLLNLEKRLSDQIVGLRRAVVEYHSSAIGHGVLISAFEERLRRLEQHVGLSSSDSH